MAHLHPRGSSHSLRSFDIASIGSDRKYPQMQIFFVRLSVFVKRLRFYCIDSAKKMQRGEAAQPATGGANYKSHSIINDGDDGGR